MVSDKNFDVMMIIIIKKAAQNCAAFLMTLLDFLILYFFAKLFTYAVTLSF